MENVHKTAYGMRRIKICAALALCIVGLLTAEQPTQFEVASVRRASSGDGIQGDCRGVDSRFPGGVPAPPLGRCVFTNVQLDHLIAMAYRLRKLEFIKGGPAWIREDKFRFAVYATAPHPESATYQQLLDMLKGLLADRFKAKLRVESKPESGYALLVAPGGTKLQPSKTDDALEVRDSGTFPRVSAMRHCTMEFLAGFLANRLDAPVADESGLKGGYDFTLTIDGTDGPAWAAAIRSVGLRLERRKVPVTYVTIESAELPGEN